MKMKKRPIISVILLTIFFFIPLSAGIFLSRYYHFTTGEDVIMTFTIIPIETMIFIFTIALWNKQNIDEWGDESDYQNSNQYQQY